MNIFVIIVFFFLFVFQVEGGWGDEWEGFEWKVIKHVHVDCFAARNF